MKSITVRDVPDETCAELAARAARSGRSLQEFLRAHLVDLAIRPDADTVIANVRNRKALVGSSVAPERILALRDEGRR